MTALEPHPPFVRVRAGGWSADLTPSAAAALEPLVGERVQLRVGVAAVSLYTTSSEQS